MIGIRLPDDDVLALRRACSNPYWVACVSRLIGNSDSTGKAHLWQAGVSGGTAFSNKPGKLRGRPGDDGGCAEKDPQMHKTPLSEWRSRSDVWALRWSLASQRVDERLVLSAPIAGSPAGFSLFEGRSLAVALPGTRCCTGSLGIPPNGANITGANKVAICVPFTTLFICNHLCGR